MSFRFSLETVLRLRRNLEDRERLQLQALLARRARLEEDARLTIQAHSALGAACEEALAKNRLAGGELQFVFQRLRACEAQATRLARLAVALGEDIKRQQSVLRQRRVERKVLEQVRERQRARYEMEAQRRSQAKLEELFLLRRTAEAATSGIPTIHPQGQSLRAAAKPSPEG